MERIIIVGIVVYVAIRFINFKKNMNLSHSKQLLLTAGIVVLHTLYKATLSFMNNDLGIVTNKGRYVNSNGLVVLIVFAVAWKKLIKRVK